MPNKNTASAREDKGQEASINWEDDDTVEQKTLKEVNAAYGAGRLHVSVAEHINGRSNITNTFFWERRQVDGNPHHGNLVYRDGIDSVLIRMVAESLAIESEFVPPLKEPPAKKK